MTPNMNLFRRNSLDEICTVPEDIISVYIVEKHIWADQGSEEARKDRCAEHQTVKEFLVDPVRPFLNDIFQHMAAPYEPSRRDAHIGQGYWIQAEFGSGKSHVLSFVGSLALGDKAAWEIVKEKEQEAGRGKRESLYLHWENGLKKKSKGKGVFVVVKTLVGSGSGTVGLRDTGSHLAEYILDAIQEQYRLENGRPLPLFPAELLGRRFLEEDLERYRKDLEKFLVDPNFFDEEQQSSLDEFLENLQNESDPGIQKDCGRTLWQFYEDYLKTRPRIPTETEEILKHAVETLLEDGYEGLLLILDEVSLFMQNRDENQRVEDEKTLVVLSNRLVQNYNLPVWTVCAAQQAIESRAGVKNIIANERLKLVPLLNDDRSYYDIALSRVRTITDDRAPAVYYEDYKKAFTWPESVGKDEFVRFFPFYPPSIDVVRAVSYGLTTVRSALYFMLQALKTARKNKARELITLWALFDDVVKYEEDPSGTTQGITSIKTKWEAEWRAYEAAKRQLGMVSKGEIKRWLPRCEKILKTLFLYHVAQMAPDGLTSEEIMNCIMEWRDHEEGQEKDKADNLAHYEVLLDKIDLQLPQVSKTDRGYVFSPIRTGIDWNDVFRKAWTDAEQSRAKQEQAWGFLLKLNGWEVKGPYGVRDLFNGHRSVLWRAASDGRQQISINWRKREVLGSLYVRNLVDISKQRSTALSLDTSSTDEDFAAYVSDRPCSDKELDHLATIQKDARILFWSPDQASASEKELILDLAAYISLVKDFKDQDTLDSRTVIDQVQSHIKADIGRLTKLVTDRYGRGRLCATDHTKLTVTMSGDLGAILEPAVATVLDATYASRDLDLSSAPATFTEEEAVKVINGLVRVGEISKTAKVDKNVSAARNYAVYLSIAKRKAERKLDTSDSIYVSDIFDWVKSKVRDTSMPVPVESVYKNFMGIGGPGGKNYGLSRRLIDLFLLCLVREGRIRISIDSRHVEGGFVDYATIERIDFKKATLQGMGAGNISLMEAPEGWDVLRPFAAVILDDSKIEEVTKDVEIQDVIRRTVEALKSCRIDVAELEEDLEEIFVSIDQENQISERVKAWRQFVEAEIDPKKETIHILDAMDRNFGYRAYADMQYRPEDRDDLASRKREIENAKEFAKRARDIRAAAQYAKLTVMEKPLKDDLKSHLKRVRKSMGQMGLMMADPAKLITDLVEPLNRIRETYETRYMQVFDQVVAATEDARTAVSAMPKGDLVAALKAMNQVSALEKADLSALEDSASELLNDLFPSELRASEVRLGLRDTPYPRDTADLIADAEDWIARAQQAREEAEGLYRSRIVDRVIALRSSGMRSLLEQGKNEVFIKKILAANDEATLADLLIKELSADAKKAKLLDKYLKKIRVVRVRLSEFDPGLVTFGQDDLENVVASFRRFLEERLGKSRDDETIIISIEK